MRTQNYPLNTINDLPDKFAGYVKDVLAADERIIWSGYRKRRIFKNITQIVVVTDRTLLIGRTSWPASGLVPVETKPLSSITNVRSVGQKTRIKYIEGDDDVFLTADPNGFTRALNSGVPVSAPER